MVLSTMSILNSTVQCATSKWTNNDLISDQVKFWTRISSFWGEGETLFENGIIWLLRENKIQILVSRQWFWNNDLVWPKLNLSKYRQAWPGLSLLFIYIALIGWPVATFVRKVWFPTIFWCIFGGWLRISKQKSKNSRKNWPHVRFEHFENAWDVKN